MGKIKQKTHEITAEVVEVLKSKALTPGESLYVLKQAEKTLDGLSIIICSECQEGRVCDPQKAPFCVFCGAKLLSQENVPHRKHDNTHHSQNE